LEYRWLLASLLNKVSKPLDQAWQEWETICHCLPRDAARERELWLVIWETIRKRNEPKVNQTA
jgi:hypothetical protein